MKARYLMVTPQQAYANQPVIIATNVINNGGEIGTYKVDLKINGKVEQTKMVSVGGGSAQQVKFTVYKSQPGTYNVAIGSEKNTFTIVIADQVGCNGAKGDIAPVAAYRELQPATATITLDAG